MKKLLLVALTGIAFGSNCLFGAITDVHIEFAAGRQTVKHVSIIFDKGPRFFEKEQFYIATRPAIVMHNTHTNLAQSETVDTVLSDPINITDANDYVVLIEEDGRVRAFRRSMFDFLMLNREKDLVLGYDMGTNSLSITPKDVMELS